VFYLCAAAAAGIKVSLTKKGGHEMDQNTTKTQEVELKDSERQPCEVWTRVMGYHRPVQSFNIGKKGEFEERKYFVESKCGCSK
jgi:hypothetical protein